jgi:hypothetical protein
MDGRSINLSYIEDALATPDHVTDDPTDPTLIWSYRLRARMEINAIATKAMRCLGEACGPSDRAAFMTACTARQPVIRLQGPETFAASLAAAESPFAEAVRQVECVEQGRGNRHGAIDPGAALLQALDHQHAGVEVDTIALDLMEWGSIGLRPGFQGAAVRRRGDPVGGALAPDVSGQLSRSGVDVARSRG